MLSVPIRSNLYHDVRLYKNRYIHYAEAKLDESMTRILINHFLVDVLKYEELVNIKTEYPVQGGFIDYLVEADGRKLFVVEAKSSGTRLGFRHLRQAIYYALSAGVSTVVLTNAKDLQIYKLSYSDHLVIDKLYSIDLSEINNQTRDAILYLKRLAPDR